jgi:calcium-dependent protein kinase
LKEVLGSVKGKMKIYEEIMGALDKNCNGVIDYSEFLVAASNKELLLSTENLKLAFNMFDKDKNGTISRPELRAVFEANETKDDQLWRDIFEEVDADGDGAITFEEFRGAMDSIISKVSSQDKYLVRRGTTDKNVVAR